MDATVLDLRKNMKDILAALGRNERVTLTYRGRKKAIIIPCEEESSRAAVDQHPAFGMWRNRPEASDVAAFARDLRRGRQF